MSAVVVAAGEALVGDETLGGLLATEVVAGVSFVRPVAFAAALANRGGGYLCGIGCPWSGEQSRNRVSGTVCPWID